MTEINGTVKKGHIDVTIETELDTVRIRGKVVSFNHIGTMYENPLILGLSVARAKIKRKPKMFYQCGIMIEPTMIQSWSKPVKKGGKRK
jgi:hypothetical protein